MGRVKTIGLLALLTAMALAGCAEEAGPPAERTGPESIEDLDLEATDTTGVIRGVVVDAAVVPIEGATIVLSPDGQSTTSAADGGFAFSNVEAGFQTMEVDAVGFTAVTVQVEVEAGVDRPDMVRVRLEPDYSELPMVEPYTFNGYIACSASTPAYRVAVCGALNIVTDILGQDPLTEDEFMTGFEIGLYPEFIQAEMDWRGTQPTSNYLSLTVEHSAEDGADIGGVSGESPLILSAGNETITAAGMHTAKWMQQRVFNYEVPATTPPVPVCGIPNPVHGGTMCAKGLGLTTDQKFQIFTHVFYRFTPEEGWTFIEDGSPPLP